MKTIIIKPCGQKNFTPIVRSALDELSNDGGVIRFERGEYHFFREGTLSRFLPVSNNDPCVKHVVFPIFGKKHVRIDGGGAEFIFHEVTFPFAVVDSAEVELSDFSVDTAFSPTGYFEVGKITDKGFHLRIDKEKTPYRIENGALVFEREYGDRSGLDRKFDLHGVSEWGVQYLFTGDCASSKENLPAKFVLADAYEEPDGAFFKYRTDNIHPIRYSEGARISSILDGGRDVDVILISESENIRIRNITVRRGIGMGIIAQLSESIEIDGFRTNEAFHGEGATLTADSMHFVNCSGKLEIKNCEIAYTMDDAINVHGTYTRVKAVNGDTVTVRIGHEQQYYFNPYRVGDTVKSLSDVSFDYTASMKVRESVMSADGSEITLKVEALSNEATAGELIESPYRMPDVHVHDNRFYRYPNLRISGAGKILIEKNSFEKATSALLVKDLAKYWYESGRVNDLRFINNTLKDCNALGGESFITVDVDGVPHDASPKIHGRVEISGNRIENVKKKAIEVAGVRELVIRNNTFTNDGDEVVVIDGKKI